MIKLYKGSHASADPHPVVLDYGKFFAAHRRGVLGYACHIANPRAERYSVTDLDEFDRRAAPRVSTRQMFTLLACAGRRPDEGTRRLPELCRHLASSPRWCSRPKSRFSAGFKAR